MTEVALGLPAHYEWTETRPNPIEVRWRTCINDVGAGTSPTPSTFGPIFEACLLRMDSPYICQSCIDRDQQASCGLRSIPSQQAHDEAVRARLSQAKSAIQDYLSCDAKSFNCQDLDLQKWEELKKSLYGNRWNFKLRTVFRTEKGYLGRGLLGVQPGDEVYLVAESAVPLVLRPMEGDMTHGIARYAMISEAYVHGIMFGEVFKTKKEIPLKELHLVQDAGGRSLLAKSG